MDLIGTLPRDLISSLNSSPTDAKNLFNWSSLKEVSKDIELMDNIEYTLKTLVDNGYKLYIISGGVDKVIYDKLNLH